MNVIDTELDGLKVIEPRVFEDDRGYFYESYNKKTFKNHGLNVEFVQDNQSKSAYGVLRGLHYQMNPHAQAKLIRVLDGEILDVVVDVRKKSSTYGKSYKIILSCQNKKQLFVPKGFAHGFVVMSKQAVVLYKCDQFYNKESESGIIYNDPLLDINWKIPESDITLSEKDKLLKPLNEAPNNFK
jgi:dTDP-4-dehydrorhamnose 3,5-epimerase